MQQLVSSYAIMKLLQTIYDKIVHIFTIILSFTCTLKIMLMC